MFRLLARILHLFSPGWNASGLTVIYTRVTVFADRYFGSVMRLFCLFAVYITLLYVIVITARDEHAAILWFQLTLEGNEQGGVVAFHIQCLLHQHRTCHFLRQFPQSNQSSDPVAAFVARSSTNAALRLFVERDWRPATYFSSQEAMTLTPLGLLS